MFRKLLLASCTFFTILLYACSVNKANTDDTLKAVFDEYGSTGCFTFLNNATGEITVYNMGGDTTRYTSGSSFHIPLSLFALQTGTLANEEQIIPNIDSTQAVTCSSLINAFKQDQDSCFKQLANKLTKPLFQQWLDSLHYGNAATGNDFANCWANNSLTISPDEQLGLMKKLYFDQLPFRKSVQQAVREMMKAEDSNLYTLSWKRGKPIKLASGNYGNWALGWIEENRHVYFFVTYAESAKENSNAASDITRKILTKYGFFQGKK